MTANFSDSRAAHEAVKKAFADGRLRLLTDPQVVARPGSPVYNALDVFVPPLVLMVSSLTLLFAFGLVEWIIALVLVLIYQIYGAPRLVHWRAHQRVVQAALANPYNLQILWDSGGLAFVLKASPDRQCVGPSGNWQSFALEFLVEAEPTQD